MKNPSVNLNHFTYDFAYSHNQKSHSNNNNWKTLEIQTNLQLARRLALHQQIKVNQLIQSLSSS